jgi:hypothetical protein
LPKPFFLYFPVTLEIAERGDFLLVALSFFDTNHQSPDRRRPRDCPLDLLQNSDGLFFETDCRPQHLYHKCHLTAGVVETAIQR